MSRLIGGSVPIMASDGSTDIIGINAEAVVYTKAFPLFHGIFFGLWVALASATGTPKVKIELEEGPSLPTVEGAAETTLFVIPDGKAALFAEINDKLAHIVTPAPVPMSYGRLKITGLATNPADTTLKAKLFIQEYV